MLEVLLIETSFQSKFRKRFDLVVLKPLRFLFLTLRNEIFLLILVLIRHLEHC